MGSSFPSHGASLLVFEVCHPAPLSHFVTEQPLKWDALVPKHRDGKTTVTNISENVVDRLDLSHDSHFQAPVGATRQLNASLEFLEGVYGPTKPLHDGHYGSWAPSPAVMIASLIASLRDDEGHILIPHFYDGVAPVSAAAKAALKAMPAVENDLKYALGLRAQEARLETSRL
ncbi:MAG: hypothetical protein ABI145_12755 [Steroidobacteraceae bacterium]